MVFSLRQMASSPTVSTIAENVEFITFSAFFALWQVKHRTCEESLSKSYADSEI